MSLIGLTTDELAKLKREHVLYEPTDIHCAAASEDACDWLDGWPCRISRLIAEVERLRNGLRDGG